MQATQTRTQKSKTAPKRSGRDATPEKIPGKTAPEIRTDAAPTVNAEEREHLIARAAYFRAEKRGFAPGCELEDWVQAEAEVRRLIGGA